MSVEVAPLAGAWIEIPAHPCKAPRCQVAPLAGAWIEIFKFFASELFIIVAPLAGAWIEITGKIMSYAAVL